MWQVAHVGTNMSRVVSVFGRRVQLQQLLLGVKHDAVLRLLVDLELRVVRPHVALPAGRRQPRDRHRRRVPRVAGRAGADRAVVVRLADAVALGAAARRGRRPFELHQRMRRPLARRPVDSVPRTRPARVSALPRRRPRPTTAPRGGCADTPGRSVSWQLRQLPAVSFVEIDEAVVVLLLLRAAG